jgi:hypothetical protein
MATLYWFGGSGTWDSSTVFNWSTVAPTAFTGAMTGGSGLNVTALTGTALAIGKTVKTCDGSYTGVIVGGAAPNWTMDTSGFFTTPCGAGTQSAVAPTSADDVIFDANAGNTLTTASYITLLSGAICRNLTTTTGVNTTFFDLFGGIDIYGNCNIGANFTYRTFNTPSIVLYMYGGTPGTTVTIAKTGVINGIYYYNATTYTQNAVFVNVGDNSTISNQTSGATVTVAGAMSTGVLLNSATMTTGAFTHTIASSVQTFSGAVFNVTGSTFNIAAAGTYSTPSWIIDASTTFTNSAATVINLGSSTPGATQSDFTGGGQSYSGTVNIIGSYASITDANTFVTFTRTGAADAVSTLYLFDNQTCTGVFTVQGNSVAPNRLFVGSSSMGTARTLTLSGATKTLKWVDFADITFSITGAAPTQTLTGDCLGNSGLTLTAATTCYAKTGATAFNYSGAMWFTTSGGAVAARVPLAQDTVVFDSNTGSGAITLDCRVLGKDVSFNSWAGSVTAVSYQNTAVWLYGNFSGTGVATAITFTVSFASRTNTTLPSTLPATNSYDFFGWGATFTLAGNFIGGAATQLNVQGCTLNTVTYDVTAQSIYNLSSVTYGVTFSGARNIADGGITATSGTITILTSGSAFLYNFTPGTTSFVLTGSTGPTPTFFAATSGGVCSLYDLVFSGNGTVTVNNERALSYNSWSNTGTTSASIINIGSTSTHTITNFNVSSTSTASILIGYIASIPIMTSLITQASIALVNPASPSFVLFKSISVTGAALSPLGVADMGNNSGISFAGNIRGYVITTVGSGSFTPPSEIGTSNAVIVFGAGGSGVKRTSAAAGSGGGASGSMAVSYNLPITSATTIYYNNNGTGNTTWVNVVSNAAPTLPTEGARAYAGASASTTSTVGASASGISPVGRFSSLGRNGGNGSAASNRVGGAGGAAPSLTYRQGFQQGSSNSTGGHGAGGQRTSGGNSTSSTGGTGGQNLLGSSAAGGTSGNAGSVGTLGGGGGGGGAAASGGNATNNGEFTYLYLNGVLTTVGTIGSSGGAGATGGNSGGVGAAGASADYAGGGAGGGGGDITANNGAGGAGGGPLIILLYTYTPASGSQAIFIG